MASPFSSSSDIDDAAIEALIAEAADLCALEQIAALNTAHLSDSPLPSNLEARFQKLKSFPRTAANEEKENIPRSLNRSESEPGPIPDPKPEELAKAEVRLSPEIKEEKPRPRESPSPPPRQMCWCFGCSPRRIQRKGGSSVGDDDDDDDEILSELGGAAAMKKHQQKLKKAWREHEKASREADKMVKWVKQVSTRINEAAIDELLKEEFK